MSQNAKKLTLMAFVLMILTSVFGVTNIGIGFYRMGYAAIPMFVIGALIYFIPYIMMVIELATGFEKEEGGIFTWMEKSVSTKFAFIGIMMWYSSYVIWMFGKSMSMWAPLSFALFGKDVTVIPYEIGATDFGPFFLGILGVILMIIITVVISKGVNKLAIVSTIGGFAVISLNFILIIGGILAFGLNGFELQQPIEGVTSFVSSPNADYQTIVPFLGFFVFAIFAYGGTEAIAGVASDLEDQEKNLRKGIFLASIFIVACYIVGFFMVGAAMKWADFPEGVSSLTALFLIMQNLGDTIAGQSGSALGQFLMRFSGLGMFLSYMGAMFALCYAPLRQMIEGTPAKFWPESFQEVNENGIRVAPLKVQAWIVIGLVVVKSVLSLINPEGAAALYELIISMTNVGMTIPYVFIIYAWYKFRQNSSLEKNVIMIKKDSTVKILFILAVIAVAFGNIFTIISPFISGDIQTGIWTIVGPVVFGLAAIVIYNRSENK